MYGQDKFYERMVVEDKIWHYRLNSAEIPHFLNQYGWRLIEDLSYANLNQRHVKRLGRDLPSMNIERMVYAEKI